MKVFIASLLLVALVAVGPSNARRIVGGQFAEEKQFPYQVALFKRGQFMCGGSIIDERWILTAAHCILQLNGSVLPNDALRMRVGTPHLHKEGKVLKPTKIIPHKDYVKLHYDIALIKLGEAIVFDETMQKLELYLDEVPFGTQVTISGHGKTGRNEPVSELLKFNTMVILEKDECTNATSRMTGIICLNNEVDNGACLADSGSPAVYQGKQVGVANFVLHDCGTHRPDGYASVPFFASWIKETMKN
ncbi:serine protease SP24D-like [Ochlerotatus camptorhynchus]|uniref:serine protease SP24D-like n=1 Tax=Ochlerotatus camptorhynchus TaxID=644619 RepID=UPI0031D93ADC